jgi:hypothetical protein
MKKRLVPGASLLVLFLGVVAVYAQKPHATVQIPFAFTAAGTELPAGTYRLTTDTSNPHLFMIRNISGGASATVPVITRLSASDSPKPQVVFDKVGEKRILSEIYIPGVDGYQIAGTKNEHTHQKVTGDTN